MSPRRPASAGAENEWGTSCGWFDYDNDGDLDLFVGNYVRWSREIDAAQDFRLVGPGPGVRSAGGVRGHVSLPVSQRGRRQVHGRLRGRRRAGAEPATRSVPMAKTMGVVPVDLDDDGWMDLVVANDTVQNFVFHNQGRRDVRGDRRA